MNILTVSPSPHIRSGISTQKIMLAVIAALIPATIAGTIVFGPRAILMVVLCAMVSMMTELVCCVLMKKKALFRTAVQC